MGAMNEYGSADSSRERFVINIFVCSTEIILVCTSTIESSWPRWPLRPLRHVQRVVVHATVFNVQFSGVLRTEYVLFCMHIDNQETLTKVAIVATLVRSAYMSASRCCDRVRFSRCIQVEIFNFKTCLVVAPKLFSCAHRQLRDAGQSGHCGNLGTFSVHECVQLLLTQIPPGLGVEYFV